MAGLQRLKYHAMEDSEAPASAQPAAHFRGDGESPAAIPEHFPSDEAAARFFMARLLRRDERPTMRSAAAEEETVPGMVLSSERELPGTRTSLLHFDQTSGTIPVFGGEAVVELAPGRALVSADLRVGAAPDAGTSPTLDAADAVAAVAHAAGLSVTAGDVPPPTLAWFHKDETDAWRLAWHVRDVPGLPPEARTETGHGLGDSFRTRHTLAEYLVDAHNGAILFYFSTAPTAAIPVKCAGVDEDDAAVEFYGARVDTDGGNAFELFDPLRRVRTFDLGLGEIESAQVPAAAVNHTKGVFGAEHRAAVTAHRNGALVQDFYKSVLQRNGIDDRGMELVSVINCTSPRDREPPEWANACWWKGRMWYGQVSRGGRLVSLAQHLVVIAHEITHGVIETSSNLVYREQSGALNESFADVMGVIIANWWRAPDRDDPSTWDWRIGTGLGRSGKPLRDFADPGSVGYPAHMDHYMVTFADLGGVHINSNIHNKAIHHLLTAVGPGGERVLSVEDVALLAYLTLLHLTRLATFAEARENMIDVARVYFSADPDRVSEVVAAVAAAYDAVGITGR